MKTPDIRTLINLGQHQLQTISDSPLLDVEVLLCFCLGKPRTFLRTWPERQLDSVQLNTFNQAMEQRKNGWPIAYIIGKREFWSREFNVNPAVLIPRPDTELLIEQALKLLPLDQPSRIIDLGTGSGIIAITLAAERPNSLVIACDIDPAALTTAQQNAAQLAVSNISFCQSDWFAGIDAESFDLVISNPPYIDAEDRHLQQGDVRFEPRSALVAADHGLADIRKLAAQSRHYLRNGGHLLIEHGYNQQQAVQTIFRQYHFQEICTHKDLGGNPRMTSGRRNVTS